MRRRPLATDEDKARVADMAELLAANMTMYVEWHWYDGDPERAANRAE